MRHEVLMPTLGPSQESGMITSWLKKPGDQVTASDTLLEIETDKATLECEAGHDGTLVELLVEAGAEARVGSVIALIASDGAAAGATEPPRASPAEEPQAPAAKTPAAPQPQTAPAPQADRIAASPLARRIAAERGIALADLVRAGVEPPLHARDLDAFDTASPAPASTKVMPAAAAITLQAIVRTDALDDFRDWFATETGAPLPLPTQWAAMASGSLRAARGDDAPLTVRVEIPGSGAAPLAFTDADLARLTRIASTDQPPRDLLIRDLSATRLSAATFPGDAGLPVLTLTAGAESGQITATLVLAEGALGVDGAIIFLDDLARRLEQPLRHLL
ncbi:biotin/lipoyl-containing protein [Pararhodobacter sp.]|uniref:biotin/lipoyl-containing protein n=1 Tax=Pararhodobacter sp. TaxID=2127056 RepID=UPI002FDE212C